MLSAWAPLSLCSPAVGMRADRDPKLSEKSKLADQIQSEDLIVLIKVIISVNIVGKV